LLARARERRASPTAFGPRPQTGPVTGHGRPKLISVEWIRFLSADLCLTRCRQNRASSRSSRTRGSGSQIADTKVALGQRGEDERVALVGLVGQRSEPLDPLGVGDLDVQRNSSSTFFWLVYWLEGERALPSG
jgi:hypothetical protein